MISSLRIFQLVLAALLGGTLVLWAGCAGDEAVPTDGNPVIVDVEISPAAAVPGESVTLVWRFALADDWHLYWAGRNDSGFPPTVDLKLPPGWVAGGLQWPAPERYISPGDILDHVYFGELVLLQKLGAPEGATVGEDVALRADIRWLACKDMCVPGSASLEVQVPVGARPVKADPDPAAEAAALLPVPLPARTLETDWEGTIFHVHHPRAQRLTFMPTDDCGQLVDLMQDGRGDRLALRFKPHGDTVGPVRGLITIEEEGTETRTYRIDFPASALAAASPGG